MLEDYLRESGRQLPDVYRRTGGDSWTSLTREVGLVDIGYADDVVLASERGESPLEEDLLRRMTAMLCADDPERAETYSRLVSDGAPRYEELSAREQTLARMLFFALWPSGGGFASYDERLDLLRSYPLVCAEIRQLAALGVQRSRYAPKGLGLGASAGSPVFARHVPAGGSAGCARVLPAGLEDEPPRGRRVVS